MNKSKISRITIFAILALLFASNFALAQTTPPPSKGNVVLTPEEEQKAQGGPEACKKFRDEVSYVLGDKTPGNPNFKAVWYEGDFLTGRYKGCYIVPGDAHVGTDGISADVGLGRTFIQPKASENVQTLIKQGKGISSDQVTAATSQNRTDQQGASAASAFVGWIFENFINVFTNWVQQLTIIAAGICAYTIGEIIKVQSLPPVVSVGWVIVRDISNMFFILILIVISLGTILRIEEYDYKKLLRDVVIMALLVNFSKEIALALMNFTSIFVRMLSPEGDLLVYFVKYLNFNNQATALAVPFGGWMSGLADALGKLTYAVVSLFTFIVLTGMFLIRLVGIYVLIVISPIAYVLYILPATQNLAKQWWQHFIKYLIWAPVALFFVKLSAIAANGGLGSISDPKTSAFQYFIITGFMLAAVLVAKQAGMVGGDMIINWTKKGMLFPVNLGKKAARFAGKWAWVGTKAGANFGAEKFLQKTGVEIRPAKWVEGWKEAREVNREARETAGMAKALSRGSALASPTTFFQRYWGIKEMQRVFQGGTKQGEEYIKEAENIRARVKLQEKQLVAVRASKEFTDLMGAADKLDEDAGALTGFAAYAKRDEARALRKKAEDLEYPVKLGIRNLLSRAKAREEEGKKLLAPDDYFTQKKIRHNVDDEMKNIHTDNWHELADFFDSAVAEGKQARAASLLLHLTKTYNENELINRTRYTRNMSAEESADGLAHKKGEFMTYSAEGAENFRKLILDEKLGLGDQGSKMIMSDVSDEAEKANHLTIMRMYTSKHGKLEYQGKEARIVEQSGEMDKMGDEKLTRSGNRLIFFNEVPDVDFDITEKRTSFITEAGLAYYAKNYQAVKNRLLRNEYNPSQAMNASLPQNAQRILDAADHIEDRKAREEYVEVMNALIDYGHTKKASATGVSVVERIYDRIVEQDNLQGRKWPPRSQDVPSTVPPAISGDITKHRYYRPEKVPKKGPDGTVILDAHGNPIMVEGRPYFHPAK